MKCNYLIVVLICLSYPIDAKLSVPKYDNLIRYKLIQSAAEIANKHFTYRKQTAILSRDVEEKLLNTFVKAFKGTVTIDVKKDERPPEQVILILESYVSFMKILNMLKPDLKGKTLIYSGAKFLIVLLEKPHRLEHINAFLWSYYALNAIVIVYHKTNGTALYTYFPYKNPLSCQNVSPSLIGFWNSDTKNQIEAYPDKIRNMNGCPLYITTNKLFHPETDEKIPLQRIKKTLLKLLRDVINFTPIISSKDYISIDLGSAKNWSDSLGDVVSGVANISVCSVAFGLDRVGLLDYSMPYTRVSLAWLAPPTSAGPIWWRLFSPLNGYLWLILLLVTVFVKSLPYIMKLKRVKKFCCRYFKNINKVHNVVVRIWGVLMGQPIRVAPKRFRDFYIIGLWIWFTFVIRSAYQSVLIGALKTDTIVGNFANLKDCADSGLRFGGRSEILAHFEHDPLIRDGFEVVPESTFQEVLQEVIEGKRHFVFATSLEYIWAYCLSQGITDNRCGYVLPDSIMNVPLVVWMKKHSPIKQLLSIWIPRIIDSGILEHENVKKPVNALNTFKSTEPSALNRNQMVSCMMCLLLGYIISTILFVLEILKYNSRALRPRDVSGLNEKRIYSFKSFPVTLETQM